MIPPEYFSSHDALFQDMSSDADEEDFGAIRAYNKSRKRTKKPPKRSFDSSDGPTSTSGSGKDAQLDVGSRHPQPARKKPRSTSPARNASTSEQAGSSDRPVGRSVSRDASKSPSSRASLQKPVLDTSATVAVPAETTTQHLPSHDRQSDVLAFGVGPSGPLVSSPTRVLPGAFAAVGLLSGEIPSPTPGARPPIRKSATTSSVKVISKDDLLRRTATAGPSSKVMAGKKKVGRIPIESKGKGKQVPYFEIAVDLMDRLPELAVGRQVLRDLTIFMVTAEAAATEQTKRKLEYVVKHGGKIQPSFDADTATHIICDLTSKPKIQSCLGMAPDDVPDNIRIVGWKWVTDSINRGVLCDQLVAERYMGRVKKAQAMTSAATLAGRRRSSRGGSPIEDPDGSQDTQERPRRLTPEPEPASQLALPTPETSPTITHTKLPSNDPLSAFYDKALYGHDDEEDLDDEETVIITTEPEAAPSRPLLTARPYKKRKGYACQDTEGSKGTGLNDDIILKLDELMKIHEASRSQDDQWKVFAYRRAIGSLRRCYKRITTVEDARQLPGIGQKTAEKIAEIARTGELQRLKFEKTGEYEVCNVLSGIYGVGKTIAHAWYQKGVRTLEDVRQGKVGLTLTEPQKIGLEHYEDLQTRMPRAEAEAIFNKIKVAAVGIDSSLQMEIMGSFRRGSPTCGDIDILLSRCPEDGRTHKGVLAKLLQALTDQGIITHALAKPDYSGDGLEAKFMGLCRLEEGCRYRRIDILTIPYEQWGASLIYFTGDDIFNRSMRLLARHKGFCLNQRGLWAGVSREPGTWKKTTDGTLIASKTEEEIFRVLGVPWQLPHERVRSR